MLLFFVLIRRQTKHLPMLRKKMEMDFWSIDLSVSCRNKMEHTFRFIKIGLAALVLNLIVVSTGQYIIDLYAHWPFISHTMYPYYIVTSVLYTIGGYWITYTHCINYSSLCLHVYCQNLLLNAYFRRIKSNWKRHKNIIYKECDINLHNRMIFGIKQHTKLIQ